MAMKKTGIKIGVALPPRHPTGNVIEGSGLMHDDAREKLIAALCADPAIEEVALCDLSNAYVRDGKVYEAGRCLSDLDLVFWYFATHVPESWGVMMLRTLAEATTVVPDPAGLLMGLDKFHAHTALRNANLPTANFSLFRASQVNSMAEHLCGSGPLLLKPRLGAFGHGIHMVDSARELVDAVQYAQSFQREEPQVFCEFFEENDISKWISTTVIGGQLVYGYRKKPEKFVDNWKVYDADRAGGGVIWVDASPVRDTALAAAKALGCDIIGFDFIWSTAKKKYLIVDENTFPGMYPHCFAESGTGSWDEHFLRLIRAKLGNVRYSVSACASA